MKMDIPTAFWEALIALITALAGYIAYKVNATHKEVTAQSVAMADGSQVATIEAPPQPVAIIEATAQVQGVWSDAAKEALAKIVPPDATITGVADSPTYHIVYWTVKR
jgi:hypothetical protein